jgi:hypothetical protein
MLKSIFVLWRERNIQDHSENGGANVVYVDAGWNACGVMGMSVPERGLPVNQKSHQIANSKIRLTLHLSAPG